MNPHALIESYVGDVVRHLPRAQRNDVAYELRALLLEELQGRADASGVAPDSELALGLLTDFGRPADVADRYRPAGFTIIKPADAPRFAQVALIGVAVQWVITLIAAFAAPGDVEWLSRLGSWWVTWGLGSFWWPGLLVTLSLVAAMVTARRGSEGEWVPRARDLDRDRVSRPIIALYIALGIIGATLVTALPSITVWGSGLPAPLLDVFAFDEQFLTWRAPWVLVLWLAYLAIGVVVLVAGRWTAVTRRVGLGLDVAWLVLLTAWILGGPIFLALATETATKVILAVLVLAMAVGVVVELRRLGRTVQEPGSAGKVKHT